MTSMEPEEAIAHVLATDATFSVTDEDIRGVRYKTFANTPKTLTDLLITGRAAHPVNRTYLVFEDQRWSYEAFSHDVQRAAHMLNENLGVSKGTRVALASRNHAEMLILMMAVAAAGGVVVFLNAWWTTSELEYALTDSSAKLVFADADRVQRLKPLIQAHGLTIFEIGSSQDKAATFQSLICDISCDAWPDIALEADDDFAIMYSSGTTGHPKGVVLTHRGAINAVYSWLLQAVIQPLVDPPSPHAPPAPRPCILIITPLFHVTATHPMFLLSIPAGAKVVVMDRWDVDEAIRLIEREKVTRFLGVPTQSADLLTAAKAQGKQLETLTYLGSGGAKRPPAQVTELAAHFSPATIATGWGMTETNAIGIGHAGADYVTRPGSAGKLFPPLQEIRFVDDQGQEVAAGEVGEITVKSSCNMRCYLNKPEATAEVLQDGWLRTGDLGRMDADGFVTILDRKKHIIIRGGENIACLDVEAALHAHPAVAEACAFSVPDDRLGEVVGAAVQLRAGHDVAVDDLKAALASEIAHFKVPEQIWMFDAPLARGATDKLDRRGIRAMCLSREALE